MVSRTRQYEKSTPISQLGGRIKLWQFLLGMLTDKNYRHIIQWVGQNGEFEIVQRDAVAKAWGERKKNPKMTYNSLGRALRHCQDGDFLAKVVGKKNVYKFICDMQMLVGYSFQELNELVNDE